MIRHLVEVTVQNATAQQFYDFMIAPTSARYRAWWPGEHLEFYIVKHGTKSHLGDVVFMDEYLGGKGRRLTGYAVVVKAKRPNHIVWQMKKAGLRLPIFVSLRLKDTPGGLIVAHEVRIGYRGLGKALDPLIKLYFNKPYRQALETHCKIEWPKLAQYLAKE
ncbi:MAG: hypothetical protein FWC76_01425 [Defluviitaleaceae bacterium]|nr:hypothetical protein [Defluviitaleaceae bacterium]